MSSARQRRIVQDQQVITGTMWGTPAETLDEMRRQAPRPTGLIWASRIVLVLIFLLLAWITFGVMFMGWA